MTEQQANELAELIRSQYPFHVVTVVEMNDKRNAPRNWIIGVQREHGGDSIIIRSRFEWDEALSIWNILRD